MVLLEATASYLYSHLLVILPLVRLLRWRRFLQGLCLGGSILYLVFPRQDLGDQGLKLPEVVLRASLVLLLLSLHVRRGL